MRQSDLKSINLCFKRDVYMYVCLNYVHVYLPIYNMVDFLIYKILKYTPHTQIDVSITPCVDYVWFMIIIIIVRQ